VLALEREDRPVGSSHIGPDSTTVLDFDLEHGFASSTNSVTPLGQCDEVDLLLSSLTAEKAGPARSPCRMLAASGRPAKIADRTTSSAAPCPSYAIRRPMRNRRIVESAGRSSVPQSGRHYRDPELFPWQPR